jgi:anti-sigma regulatory factor (Ser/Thr protein kinase)
MSRAVKRMAADDRPPSRQSALPSRIMSGGGATRIFTLRNELSELEPLAQELEAFGAANGLPASTVFALNLALEETVTNIISYGYDDEGPHVIEVELTVQGNVVSASVADDGRAFDPLARSTPDITAPIEEREVGGLGVLLVRKLMDEVTYARVDGRNRLTFRKQVSSSSPSTAEI